MFIWKKFNEGESTRISDELSLIGIGPSFRGEKWQRDGRRLKNFNDKSSKKLSSPLKKLDFQVFEIDSTLARVDNEKKLFAKIYAQ